MSVQKAQNDLRSARRVLYVSLSLILVVVVILFMPDGVLGWVRKLTAGKGRG